jgi:hypothetical protein
MDFIVRRLIPVTDESEIVPQRTRWKLVTKLEFNGYFTRYTSKRR